jgi:hypothetical protein
MLRFERIIAVVAIVLTALFLDGFWSIPRCPALIAVAVAAAMPGIFMTYGDKDKRFVMLAIFSVMIYLAVMSAAVVLFRGC